MVDRLHESSGTITTTITKIIIDLSTRDSRIVHSIRIRWSMRGTRKGQHPDPLVLSGTITKRRRKRMRKRIDQLHVHTPHLGVHLRSRTTIETKILPTEIEVLHAQAHPQEILLKTMKRERVVLIQFPILPLET
jgi:hypothetical protein